MAPIRLSRSHPEARRYRRAVVVGLVLSVVLHVALTLAWRGAPGPGVSGSRAEAPRPERSEPWRTGAVEAVALETAEPAADVPSPPEPVPEVEPDVSAPRVTESAELAAADLAPRSPAAPGGGGEAAEATAGGGSGRPPVPRSVLPEWDPPEEVRGTEVMVRVHVDSTGRPTGPVELRPPVSDADFDRRLREKVRAMEFAPAREGGRAVAGWAELTFVF